MVNTFSINNYTLRKYLVKLLNYPSVDSKSYKKVAYNLRGNDDFVLSLIGGTPEYKSSKGLERTNFINELLAEVRYKGDDTLKHISYAARNLHYEIKFEDNMNKRELFTELRKLCAESKNPRSRHLFNELVKSFDCAGGCPGGASVSASGMYGAGVDLKGEPISQEEIDEMVKDASRGVTTFSKKITSPEEFKKWLFTFYKKVHGNSYNQDIATKVADDLINKYGTDYGSMVGAARSFMFE